jgi:hypothetical protein
MRTICVPTSAFEADCLSNHGENFYQVCDYPQIRELLELMSPEHTGRSRPIAHKTLNWCDQCGRVVRIGSSVRYRRLCRADSRFGAAGRPASMQVHE